MAKAEGVNNDTQQPTAEQKPPRRSHGPGKPNIKPPLAAEEKSTPRKAQFTKADIEGITRLIVEGGLTESEACRRLGRDPKSWWKFKCALTNREDFSTALENAKASRIEALMQEIHNSATGKGMKQRDWRAADRLLQILDRERFGTTNLPINQQNATVNVFGVDKEELKKITARVFSPAAPKQIEARKEIEPVEQIHS